MSFISHIKEEFQVIQERDPAIKTPLEVLLYPDVYKRQVEGCPTVRKGAKGELTRWIQKRLSLYLNVWSGGGQADGIFGEKTEQNIRHFQKTKGLSADGVVGKKTWSALLQSRGK